MGNTDIATILNELGLSYKERSRYYVMPCYIHGGDNPTALVIYKNSGSYVCFTHGCEHVFGSSFSGLLRGILSHQKYGWTQPGDKTCSTHEVKTLLKTHKWEPPKEKNDNLQFIKLSKVFEDDDLPVFCQFNEYYDRVKIPSRFFVEEKQFDESTVTYFQAGDCHCFWGPLSERAVVPVIFHNKIVGCLGRSPYPRCAKCNGHHKPESYCIAYPKWISSHGFSKSFVLYNYDNIDPQICNGHIFLVESTGNVWRMHEAGIYNVVACLGTHLSRQQFRLLRDIGINHITVLFDNDDNNAGLIGAKHIKGTYSSSDIIIDSISLPSQYNDIGDMHICEIQELIRNDYDHSICR